MLIGVCFFVSSLGLHTSCALGAGVQTSALPVFVIAFGLFLLGLPQPAWMLRECRLHAAVPGGHPASAYLLGLAFAFGWTPCIGPILGSILTVSAGSATVADGAALLAVYSLGLGVPLQIGRAHV